jgi:hypothetical protein
MRKGIGEGRPAFRIQRRLAQKIDQVKQNCLARHRLLPPEM